nr:putative ribonuclease H-like domain-containing protein [Tanacetum cinerariifolium]
IETTFQAATSVPASPKSNSSGKRRNKKACFVCKSVDHLIKDCDYHSKKMAQPTPRNYANRGHHKQYVPLTQSKSQKHKVPTAVLTQPKPVSNTVVRPVSTALPNITMTRPRHANQVVTKSKSPIRRHLTRNPSSRTSNSPPRVNTVQVPVVSAAQGNPKDGKITGKGKIRTGKLEFDNVYFVKELKFNLFSVSQMCDKKNSVLFTDTEYLVLSFDFKLLDKSQVLLRVPRENNMYNVHLKNIVPSGDLTCLFAKATLDESNLWHRRLAHVNFKTINKLVKGNLVRGLPTKVFKNDHTCVACKKGKQHRASCMTKPVSSVDQPLFRLHMDLCVFLATKDENTPILKTFLTGLENQLSLKVKVIKSNNGNEFKNSDLNQFSGLKVIKREFSIPRTPQQNGIAERKNRTLIEAARTMLVDSLLPIPFWIEAVNTACYVQNRVLVTKPHNKTLYELLHGRTPIHARNQTNSGAGFQDALDAEKAREEVDQSYMLFPVWSFVGSINPYNNAEDAAFDGKEHDFDVKKPESKVILSPSRLEDIIYSDDEDVVGAEADLNNLESSIPVGSIPTTRIHKDHPVSQIIGDFFFNYLNKKYD